MSLNTEFELDTEISGGFLGDLGPPIRRYPYKGTKQLLETVKMELSRQKEGLEASEWVLFTNVDKETFGRDFLNSEEGSFLERCWNSYDSSQHLVLVKLTASRPHHVAAQSFHLLFHNCLRPMGLQYSIRSFGSATCTAENGSSKQPDCQFLPKELPRDRTKQWPSVVVEIGFSESPSKLRSDARFWLCESNGDVQSVITITIGRTSPNIVLEEWQLVNNKVKRQQVTTIKRGEHNNIDVQGDPFIISFDKLFLRGPNIPRETDINLDNAMLTTLAWDVWDEQEF
ncbi:hypothetical protein PITC_051860 [Penicillium italicum]|uniref:Uncharacterized protein n=1 Tax=Penicillium italicum TaxID=40296 RepID=A0A0A2KRW7_PENIT|nr:hypothetical protein PITC_051860 [Penicillium italicum]